MAADRRKTQEPVVSDTRSLVFTVQASCHQGSPSFTAPGRQCMFNSIASCIMNETLPVQTWNTEVLDRILKNGDQMCVNTYLRDTYPRITDLEKQFCVDGNYFQVNVADSYCGSLSCTDEPYFSIEKALEKAAKYSVLTVGSGTPAYSCGVIKADNCIYVFDPHSRDQLGMSVPDGKSTLTKHFLEEMTPFLLDMTASLSTFYQFELSSLYVNRLSTAPPASPQHSGMNLDSIFLGQESENFDSDTDSADDIPLGSIKALRCQVDYQRNRKIKKVPCAHLENPDTRPRESKEKARARMQELMVTAVCPSPDAYGHISDSDGDNDETYLPPPPKRTKSNEYTSLDATTSEDPDNSHLNPELSNSEQDTTNCSDSILSTESSFLDNSQSPGDVASSAVQRGRRRQRDPDNWVFNIAKRKRNSGAGYITRKGKVVKAREMKRGCGDKCRLRCHNKISNEQRESIFHGFWQMGCLIRQRDFISKNVEETKKKRVQNQGESRRSRSIKWYFEVNSEKIQVCKTFFLETLDIGDTMVYTAIKKTNDEGIVQPDRRGKLIARPNEKGDEKEAVRAHINSFPRTESHYCRKETKRFYLNGELSLQKLYAMYKQERVNDNKTLVSESTYKQIFYTEFNLGFFRRSKDGCDFCVSYKNEQDKDNEEKKTEYEKHHKMKNQARELKDADKQRAKNDREFSAATFDLEDVLVTPKGSAKGFYYKRRLNTYNLSIYDYETELGINHIWNERIGKRGSNEIGSCVYKYILSQIEKGKTIFSFFSDACGGQNRNKHIVALFWWIRTVYDLKEVKHTFFVSGHSQNEVDGIHSRIEQTCRHVDIYTTPQWAACIRTARQKPPHFAVHELDLIDIKNMKAISEQIQNFDIDTNKEKIQYLKLKRIRVREDRPNIIDMSYDYDDDSWFQLDLEKRGRKRLSVPQAKSISLQPVQNEYITVDEHKLKDLDSLCQKNLIPKVHHAFYKALR